jgi:hypothetical protein
MLLLPLARDLGIHLEACYAVASMGIKMMKTQRQLHEGWERKL